MLLSIITVNYNDKEKILDQIRSVQSGTSGILFEQIVVDNGSSDDSLALIRAQFPQVQIVENGENLGFGEANNRGVHVSSGEFVLFLNPDMRVAPGSLGTLVNWMRAHPDVGIASCRLVDQEGLTQQDALPRRFPNLWHLFAMLVKIPHFFPWILNRYLYHGFDPKKEQDVDSVRGSFLLTRRTILDTLGWAFDPRYFIWFEDVDTCREVKRLGFRVVYTPIVSCVDYVGQTFKRQPSYQKQVWFTQSMVVYVRKWYGNITGSFFALVRWCILGTIWIVGKVSKKY